MKTIKTNFGFEATEVMHLGKSFNEIKNLIPKGFEIINNIQCNQLYGNIIKDEWIWCLCNGNPAWFGANSDRAFLDCVGDPSYSGSSLGVRYVRNIRSKDENTKKM